MFCTVAPPLVNKVWKEQSVLRMLVFEIFLDE